MIGGRPTLQKAAEQPISSDTLISDGVFAKPFRVAKAHTFLPQHSHVYDHVSVIVRGAVRLWCDGELLGDHAAPTGILIKAGVKHLFETLEDDTIILCVHDIGTAESVEIAEENNLLGEA
jgi:hypothetical protein